MTRLWPCWRAWGSPFCKSNKRQAACSKEITWRKGFDFFEIVPPSAMRSVISDVHAAGNDGFGLIPAAAAAGTPCGRALKTNCRQRPISNVRPRRTPKFLIPNEIFTLHAQLFTLHLRQVLVWTGSPSSIPCASRPSFPLGQGPMGALDLTLVGQAKPGLPKVLPAAKRLYDASAAPRLWRGEMADTPFLQEVF